MRPPRAPGIYTLTVPTGGGKTLTALRYALEHARIHGLTRVIFVSPYISIVDQNAAVARGVLEQEQDPYASIVLEHHSNLARESELPSPAQWRRRVLAESWDAPIVFTTSAQVLDALFGQGTRPVRRLHAMAEAVLLFDEVQTLPIKVVHLFNNAINFLASHCKSSILLCTATQPLLSEVDQKKGTAWLGNPPEIVDNVQALFESLRRYEVFDHTDKPICRFLLTILNRCEAITSSRFIDGRTRCPSLFPRALHAAFNAALPANVGLCLGSGESIPLADSHPKRLRHGGDGAKLISSSDNSGFTYRGRFQNAAEAYGLGSATTQKVHNALRWLIARQGARLNKSSVLVAWEVQGALAIPILEDSWQFLHSLDDSTPESEQKTGREPAEDSYQGDAGQHFALRLLVEKSHAQAFAEELGKRYEAKFGIKPEIHICHASNGAHRIS